MADIPDTTDVRVALIAAALEISKNADHPDDVAKLLFRPRLRRYLTAYKALATSASLIQNGQAAAVDIEKLMQEVSRELGHV